MTQINDLKKIYYKIEEGSVLAFYQKSFWKQIIPFFTREQKDEQVPQHVGICFDIQRNSRDSVSFYFSDQSFHGGRYRKICITKFVDQNNQEIFFADEIYFMKQDGIKLFVLKERINENQKIIGIKDAVFQIGKKYSYNRLLFGVEFLEKILTKEFQRKLFLRLNKKEVQRVCSTHVQFNLFNMGVLQKKDDFLTPLEITKLDIFENV